MVYPLQINSLPVYDQNGLEFGISLTVGPSNTVQYAHYPRSLSLISAAYPRVDSFQTILDYLGNYYGSRMYGMPVEDGTLSTRNEVEIKEAKAAYTVSMSYSKTGEISQYIVPALSFEIPKDAHASTYTTRLVLPTIKSFYDTAVGGDIMPMYDAATTSAGVAK